MLKREMMEAATRAVQADGINHARLEGTDSGGYSYDDYRAFLPAVGFRELTRTARGWTKD